MVVSKMTQLWNDYAIDIIAFFAFIIFILFIFYFKGKIFKDTIKVRIFAGLSVILIIYILFRLYTLFILILSSL